MPNNQKIKSVTVTDNRNNETIFTFTKKEFTEIEIQYELEPEKPKSNVKYATYIPNEGTLYCYVDGGNRVAEVSWDNDDGDKRRYRANNVFIGEDREANAQKQADRNQLLADIQRFADSNNEAIDWKNGSQFKYMIPYNHEIQQWEIVCINHNEYKKLTYFSSHNLATQALTKFKDRLDILLD